jgi:competence protein ComEC
MLTLIDQTIGGEEGEFLKGLLLGERGGLSSATREAFTNSGVAHILAVSGSNVAVVATILVFVSGFLRLPRALRTIAVSFGLLCYMVLSGNQPPVVRATIMALVFVLGRVFQEKQSVYNALGISALIILGIDARQLFDVGFQLSFVAVLSIVYLYPKVNAWLSNIPDRSAWRRATVWTLRVCAVSAVATLGTLPLTAMYFGRVSVIGIVSNIVVIPAAEVSVVLGFLSLGAGIFSSWLAGIYGEVNHLLLALTLWVTDLTGRLSFAYFETLRFMPADAIPFYAGLGLVTHLRVRDSARRCFVLFLAGLNIALFAPAPPQYARHSGTLRVSFIDVGQGDAMLVEFPDGKSMVIDAGPRNGSYDAGERTVVPFLKRRGISTVDLLVVTHPDNDHIAGAHAVFEQLDVRRVIDCGRPSASDTYEQYLDDVREEQCPHESVRAGRLITDFTGARLYVLSPLHSFVGGDATYSHESLNNSSVVMKVQYGFVSFLLTGDAEAGAEHGMVSAYGGFLRANVLKVGHHGSASGTSEEFLHCVQPVMAVISVGRNNRFHHPSSMIIHRLTDMQSHVLRTDEQGAIIMETDGRTFSCINWR